MNTTREKIHGLAFFWPGLPQLWTRGSWVGLVVAVGFTALANVLLWSTLVYSQWLTREVRLTGLGLMVVVWGLARWQSRAWRRARLAVADPEAPAEGAQAEESVVEADQWLRAAQGYYLQNDWVRAEQVLLKLLKHDRRDVESRLMLATLWRHQGRTAEALRQLDRLERLEAASAWKHEIAAERMALAVPVEVVPAEPDESSSGNNQTDQNTNSGETDREAGPQRWAA